MAQKVLVVEGVNFDQCLYDTNDLSVIRGASLLLDGALPVVSAAVTEAGARIVSSLAGASSYEIAFDGAEATVVESAVREALAQNPWRALSWVVSVADTAGVARGRNRRQQFQTWTVKLSAVPGASCEDALDRVRPAVPGKDDAIKGPLSPETRIRLEHGRKFRRDFFRNGTRNLVGEDTLCASFEELVNPPPKGLREGMKGKIAVVHFDGDRMGELRRLVGDDAIFSAQMSQLTEAILQRIVEGIRRRRAPEDRRFRMEVLLWGEDDITLVVPAWDVLEVIRDFQDAISGAEIAKQPVSFTGAAIVANYKAPVRKLVHLAERGVKLSKQAGVRGAITFDIFKMSPPERSLEAHRAQLFPGTSVRDVAFAGRDFGALMDLLLSRRQAREKGQFLSRSRAHDLVQASPEERGELMRKYHLRVLHDAEDYQSDAAWSEVYALPYMGEKPRDVALDLMLWLDLDELLLTPPQDGAEAAA